MQPIPLFIRQGSHHTGNNNVTQLESHLRTYISPAQLMYACAQLVIHSVSCNTQWAQMH